MLCLWNILFQFSSMSKKTSSFYRKVNQETDKCFNLISTENDCVFGEVFDESKTDNDIQSTSICNSLQHDNIELDLIDLHNEHVLDENWQSDESYHHKDSGSYQDTNESCNMLMKCSTEFKSKLKFLVLKHRISQSAVTDILRLLKTTPFEPNDLPSDARTLVSTPRNIEMRQVHPGNYCHVGVQTAINSLIRKTKIPDEIELLINIDGLPLSKSSGSQLYPILCSMNDDHKNVAIIGMYHGYEKPASANDFLQEFVEEAVDLTKNGVVIGEHKIPFTIKGFICDAPAKSYISYRKGHTGFYSCTKCKQKGVCMKGRTCFPKVNCTKRTDEDFRKKAQSQHHLGTSILENIPTLNMIESFPLEYMHLVCLGVVKKLIVNLWLFGKPPNRIPPRSIQEISSRLISFQNHVPKEFVRKPRSLDEVKRWKATEFRFFLFYLGPVVLKNVLADDKYLNFLCLHISMRILNDCVLLRQHLDYASSLLIYFVQNFAKLYGKEFVSHNVHGLIHVAEDVRKYGRLENYSAFPFENHLQSLKKMIRKHEKPLAQIMKRMKEFESTHFALNETPNQLLCHHSHCKGPVPDMSWTQYEFFGFDSFSINIKKPADSFCLLNDQSIIRVFNILKKDNQIYIYGKKFLEIDNFFSRPCESSAIGIFLVRRFSIFYLWPVESISKKVIAFPQDEGYVILPLMHNS